MIHILAVLAGAEREAPLREIARSERWNLKTCAGLAEAAAMLRTGPGAEVIVLDSPDWRNIMGELRNVAPAAAILVVGSALWKDVVELGGYGVLAKPLHPAETARTILHASWFAASRAQLMTPLRTA